MAYNVEISKEAFVKDLLTLEKVIFSNTDVGEEETVKGEIVDSLTHMTMIIITQLGIHKEICFKEDRHLLIKMLNKMFSNYNKSNKHSNSAYKMRIN